MNIEDIRNTLCTGCSSCFNTCNVGAIQMSLNERGFYVPAINKDKCVKCNLCNKVCPILNNFSVERKFDSKVFAVQASDQIRLLSSSGGMFTLLAEFILNLGGVVYGVKFNNDFKPIHAKAENLAELECLKKSKYVQSYVGLSYRDVERNLKNERYVMFVGTPCQIAGLLSYCAIKNVKTDLLLTVDVFCFYNPSHALFKKFLNDTYGKELENFQFRLKEENSYASHYFKYKLKKSDWINVHEKTPWFVGYFCGLYAHSHCLSCKFQYDNRHRIGDISLGDYWGIEHHDNTFVDGKGTSMVITNSQKGFDFVHKIKQYKKFVETPYDWIRSGQSNIRILNDNQKKFFNLIDLGINFNKSVNVALSKTKYDIGLCCVQTYDNFGSCITNFALYEFLKQYNLNLLIINQPLSSIFKPNWNHHFLKSPFDKRDYPRFFKNTEDMKQLNKVVKVFLLGSDQLFNYNVYKYISSYSLLNWVDDSHKKFSFATSFGMNKLFGNKIDNEFLKASLKRFTSISLREESSIDFAKKYLGINAVHCLDPVFLCDKTKFYDLSKNVNGTDSANMFGYILDPTKSIEALLFDISKRLRLPLHVVSDLANNKTALNKMWNIECDMIRDCEHWISSICHTDFVVTDSFHGLCFSLIFHKPFVVIKSKRRGFDRVASLLKLIGYEHRLIDSDIDSKKMNAIIFEKIDFKKIDFVINSYKQNSIHWFETNVLQAVKNSN